MNAYIISGDGRQVFIKGGGLVANCAAQWADDGDDYGLQVDENRGKTYAQEICKMLNMAAHGNTHQSGAKCIHEAVCHMVSRVTCNDMMCGDFAAQTEDTK